MSNEYKDWVRDGGACTDCEYNKTSGDRSVCVRWMPQHTNERCNKFKDIKETYEHNL